MNRETYEKIYFQENYASQFGAFRDSSASHTASAHAADRAPMPNATTVVMMEDTFDGGVTITTGDFVAFFNQKYGHDRIGAMRRSIVQAQRNTELKRARPQENAADKKSRSAQKRAAAHHSPRSRFSFVRVVFGLMLVLSIGMILTTSFLLETTRTQVIDLENEVSALEMADTTKGYNSANGEESVDGSSFAADDSVEVYTDEEEKLSPVAALLNALVALAN